MSPPVGRSTSRLSPPQANEFPFFRALLPTFTDDPIYFQNLLEMLYLVAFSNFSLGPSQINRFFPAYFSRLNIHFFVISKHISPYFSTNYQLAFSDFLALKAQEVGSFGGSVLGLEKWTHYQKKVVFSRFLLTGWAQFDPKHLVGICQKFCVEWCALRHTIVGGTKTAAPYRNQAALSTKTCFFTFSLHRVGPICHKAPRWNELKILRPMVRLAAHHCRGLQNRDPLKVPLNRAL